MKKFSKNKSTLKTLLRVLTNMGSYMYIYLFCIIVATGSMALFSVISAYMLRDVTAMAQARTMDGIVIVVVRNTLLAIMFLLLWRAGIVRYNIEAKRGIARLEKQVFSKAMKLPMSYYENNHSGDFMSRLIYDTGKAGDIYGSRLRRLVSPALSVIVYLIPMFFLSPQLTAVLLFVSSIMLIVNTAFVKPMKEVGAKMSGKNSVMTECLTNILSGIELSKMFGADKKLLEKYKNSSEDFLKSQKKQSRMSASLEGINEFFGMINALVFLAIGVFFVSRGITSLSNLAAVYAMYGPFGWQFLQIGRYMPELTNCIANAERIFEFLDSSEEPEKYETEGAINANDGFIVLEDVSFSYDEERKILDKFSITVEKGKTVAITGKSGKGKSTLAKLLLGFYKPDEGRMSINGIAYKDLTLSQIRDYIAYVPQEPYLYGISIADNIGYGKAGASREEIIEAAKAANAHDFIMKLPDGYDTISGERGNTLSGGEKQRIAIARAVLKDAPVFILDEATSALDNESELLVSEAIERLAKDKTTIMIAHRPSTIARADVVVNL